MKRLTTFLAIFLFALTLQGQKVLTYQGDVSLMDEGKGIFTPPSTESWVAQGNNTIANDAGALKITYVDNNQGAKVFLNAAADLSTNLTIGKNYRLRIKAKHNGVGSTKLFLYDGESGGAFSDNLITDYVWYETTFIALRTDLCYIRNSLFDAGSIIWIDEWSIQEWYPDGRIITVHDANLPLKTPFTLSVWYDGKHPSSFTLDGTSVDNWADRSGNGHDAANGNADATRPTYDINTGRVTFIAANSTFLQSAGFGPLAQPNTIFVVYKITGGLADNEGVFDAITSIAQLFYINASAFKLHAGAQLVGPATNANDNIHVGEFYGLTSNYWINGDLVDAGDIGASVLDGITLGARGGLTTYADCEIMEVLVYDDEVSDVWIDMLTGYLDDKWNIPATTDFKGYIVMHDESEYFKSTWKTDNAGISNDDQITLPLESGGTYNFAVSWGDGSFDRITTWNQAETTHTYSSAGTYEVQVNGTINGWRFNNGGDKLKILTVENWGDLLLGTFLGSYFYGCTNLVINATDELDVSAITNFNYGFYGCASMTAINVGSWDVSSVTSFRAGFRNCTVLATLDVSSWDVGNVSNFIDIFQDCLNINNLDVSLWNVSSGTNFEYAFHGCKALVTLNVSAWNTSNATTFEYTFGDLGGMIVNVIGADNWDITSVTNMTNMFRSITLTTAAYDAILIAWAALAIQNNVVFHAGNSTFTLGGAAETAHDHLTAGGGHNWTITDGGGI